VIDAAVAAQNLISLEPRNLGVASLTWN